MMMWNNWTKYVKTMMRIDDDGVDCGDTAGGRSSTLSMKTTTTKKKNMAMWRIVWSCLCCTIRHMIREYCLARTCSRYC